MHAHEFLKKKVMILATNSSFVFVVSVNKQAGILKVHLEIKPLMSHSFSTRNALMSTVKSHMMKKP